MTFIVILLIKMSKTLLILSVAIFCSTLITATIVPHLPPIHSHVPRTYKLSLDDTPEQRWAQVIRDYREPLAKFM